jgi:hypothetical protein
MKGIFWNSRGLSDLAKSRFLADTSKERNLDFIALLETCKKDFSQPTLDNFSGGKISCGIGLPRMVGRGDCCLELI